MTWTQAPGHGHPKLSNGPGTADNSRMLQPERDLRSFLEISKRLKQWWRRGQAWADVPREVWQERFQRTLATLSLDSLKRRIVTFAIVATLLPSLATAWIAYSQNKRSITDKISENLASSNTQVAREIELWVAEVLDDLRVFAISYEVTENLERLTRDGGLTIATMETASRLHDYLGAVEPRFENYRGLRVVDSKGESLAMSGSTGVDFAFPNEWRGVLRGGKARLGDPFWDDSLGMLVVPAIAPVKSANGDVLGALIASVNLSGLRSLIEPFVPAADGVVYLLSATRQPVISYSRASIPSHRPDEATADLYDVAPVSAEYVTLVGDRRVAALGMVHSLDWAVLAELPWDVAYGRITRLRNLTLLIVTLLLAFVAAIAYYMALVIVKPLHRLTEGAAAVASGDLAVDLPVLGGGEVGYLTHVFNDMVARLREGRRQLATINEMLLEKNEELAQLSSTDSLTGLYNRRHLMDALLTETQRATRTERPYTVLMIDVDHFKSFNDAYGHQAGDEVLVALGGVLRRVTRDVDCAARYGGEEFFVLLPETNFAAAGEVAERIRTQVSALVFAASGNNVSVTLSIGLAEFPRHGTTFELVIQAADAALYEAKRSGRNRVMAASESNHGAETSAS